MGAGMSEFQKAIFAAGCFWGVEHLFRKQEGVISTRVGYIGGKRPNPTYEQVCTGVSGHAEALEVAYDPEVTSYKELLLFFFKMHDPTTKDRQHNDIGSQYRSAVFPVDAQQEDITVRVIDKLNKKNIYGAKVVTTIEPLQEAGPFYEAEDYHQEYLLKHPDGYNCHILRRDLDFSDI